MICPKCNTHVDESSKFCPECGHSFVNPDDGKQTFHEDQSGPEQEKAERQDPELITRIKRSHFVNRVFNILIKPVTEWQLIAATKPRPVFMIFGYLLILGLIVLPALYLGYVLDLLRVGVNYSQMFVLGCYCLIRILGLILFPVIAAVIINALRPSFGVAGSFGRTLQLTVYSATPVFLSWAFFLLPFAFFYGVLVHIISLYAVLLLIAGYRRVLVVPDNKRIGFFFTVLGIFYGTYYILYFVIPLFYRLFYNVGGPDAGL